MTADVKSTSSSSMALPPAKPPSRASSVTSSASRSSLANPATRYEQTKERLKPYLGVLLLSVAELLASMMSLITRYLQISLPPGREMHALQIMFVRMSATLVISLVTCYVKKVPHAPFGARHLRVLLTFRGLAGTCALFCYYSALRILPLPDATVIQFLVPIGVGIACAVIPAIREPFTRKEVLGAVVSLFGVILIARPPFLWALIPRLGAEPAEDDDDPDVSPSKRIFGVTLMVLNIFGATMAYTFIRWIGQRAHSLIPVIYFSGTTTVFTAVCLFAVPSLPSFVMPEGAFEWSCTAAMGLGGFFMQFLLTKGMQLEKGGRAAQIIYTNIVYSILFEWIVWGNIPAPLSWTGGALILGSAAYVNLNREKEKARAKKPENVDDEETALLADDDDDDDDRD